MIHKRITHGGDLLCLKGELQAEQRLTADFNTDNIISQSLLQRI